MDDILQAFSAMLAEHEDAIIMGWHEENTCPFCQYNASFQSSTGLELAMKATEQSQTNVFVTPLNEGGGFLYFLN